MRKQLIPLLLLMLFALLFSGAGHAVTDGRTGKSWKKEGTGKPTSAKKKKSPPALEEPQDEPATVKSLQHWSNPDYTRIAISLDREAQFEYHRLAPNRGENIPPRIYIDITGARTAAGVKDITIGDGLLKGARIGQFRPGTVRVVLDLESMKDFKVFSFSDPFSIIIDIRGDRQPEISGPGEPAIVASPEVPEPPPTRVEVKPAKVKRQAIGKVRRVVVDAGHGGHDPGAVGSKGSREKDVVLQIALKLARKLREDLGLDVVLTRSTDVFLELKERTAIANKVGADLFVSIHANASMNHNSNGIETYYLNLAKTEKVAQLAAQENGTSLEKVSLLQAVLFDLMANYKLNDSAHLADEVQKSVHRRINGKYSGVKNLGVKQGPFYVLVGATMPSILVETAFVSNPTEENRLNDPAYQELTAEGITDGVKAYIAGLK